MRFRNNRRNTSGMILGVLAAACLAVAQTADAKVIDGNLGDWGATPFTDWAPDAPIRFVEEDYPGPGSYPYGGETFDVEAMYMDWDATSLYIGLITSFPQSGAPNPNHPSQIIDAGDLLLDLDHGDGFQWEYGVTLNGATKGRLYYRPIWILPQGSAGIPANGPSNIDLAHSSPPVGTAQVGWFDYGTSEGDGTRTYGVEVAIAWADLGNPSRINVVARHTMGCGNDMIELGGVGAVPEPATTGMLALGGLVSLGWRTLKRRSATSL